MDQLDAASTLTFRMERAMEACRRNPAQLVALTVPAPLASPAQAFGLHSDDSAHYFATGDKGGDVGFGAVVKYDLERAKDLAAVEAEAQAVLDHAVELGIDASAKAPRFYGGVAFDRSPVAGGPWAAFGGCYFALPRYRYLTDGQRASLTLHVLTREIETTADRQAWILSVERLLSELAQIRPTETLPKVRLRRAQPSTERWFEQVQGALAAMDRGPLEKVVLAREITLEFESVPSVSRILENLNLFSPETTRFAFRRGKSVFVGATPERLILRLGSELRTEAVAGSIRALDADGAVRLMESEKERYEHDLVVRELLRKLELLGARAEVHSRPVIRQLRHVLHLATTITARLFGPPHILSIMSRLHPTPAVCGVPEEQAREFMRREEAFERGWYAAPVGWFDGQGDGEFVVGLRSGLLTDNVLRLYAGAGIVRDSLPEKELLEIELKLQSMLEAIGSTDATFAAPRRPEPDLRTP